MTRTNQPPLGATLRLLRNFRLYWRQLRFVVWGIAFVAVVMISYGTPFLVPLGAVTVLIVVVVVIRRRTGGPSAG